MIQEFILKNLITIVFILFAIFSFVKGFKKGFIQMVLSLGAIIITIIATKIMTPIVSETLKDITNIESTLSDMIYNALIESTAYDKFNLEGLTKIINTGDIGLAIKNSLCNNIANIIINLICGFGVFVIVLIVVKILIRVLDVVDYIPVVGQLNKLLGGILGIVEFVIFVWILFIVLKIFENVPQVKVLVLNIKGSFIVGAIYDNNILYNFFSSLFSFVSKKKVV